MNLELKKQKIPFTQIPNNLINDTELKLADVGMYVFMSSKPEGWNFTSKSMSKQLNISVYAVDKSLKKLKEKGWISYRKNNNGTGVYYIYVKPLNKPNSEIQSLPNSEIRSLRNSKRISNTDLISNKDISTTKEKIEKNLYLIEVLSMQQRVKPDTIKAKIDEFILHRLSLGKTDDGIDLFNHFSSWIRKQKLSDVDLEMEFNSFMTMFNKVSTGEFVGTKEIKDLFIQAINNGFTGKQILAAIRNLYSTNNKWHKNNAYVFATPEHLLKDENLNKYLNANF